MLNAIKTLIRKIRRKRRDPIKSIGSGLSYGSYLLYGIARTMRPQTCVEIGSARGLSACMIGKALKENGFGKLYAIDPHVQTNWNDTNSIDTYGLMRANLARFGVQNYVEIIREFSSTVARDWHDPIDLLFIDGDHSYEGVKSDWEGFSRHIKPFGLVVFHDTTWAYHTDHPSYRSDLGVHKFLDELRHQGYPIVTIDQYCGLSIVQPVIGGMPLMRT